MQGLVALHVGLVEGEEEAVLPFAEFGPAGFDLSELVAQGSTGGDLEGDFVRAGDVAQDGEEEDAQLHEGDCGLRMPMQGRLRKRPW